jgi:ABC-type multidrug transport system fused ATPase/permease subunit
MSDDEDNFRSAFASALASTKALAGHLDEDSTEYMLSILLDDPSDEDARESVRSILSSFVDEENVCDEFFAALDASLGNNATNNQQANNDDSNNNDENELPRRLDNAITLNSQDIQSFASGLVADKDSTMDDPNTTSDIQQFYANMIDVSNVQGRSERDRRKARQKEIREKMEEEERKRAIDDAMRMMVEEEESAYNSNNKDNNNNSASADGGGMSAQEMSEMTNATDNSADVRLLNFNLANRKGGGQDLLEDASLILARGRRYGLMGRNGCGKVRFIMPLYHLQILFPKLFAQTTHTLHRKDYASDGTRL